MAGGHGFVVGELKRRAWQSGTAFWGVTGHLEGVRQLQSSFGPWFVCGFLAAGSWRASV